jgi:hypothetical protein
MLLCGSLSWATTYYVSATGADANNGTTILTPWRTCSRVTTQTLNPGDSVLFKAGDCWRERFNIDNSGAAGNYIYFGRYGEGKNPIIVASNRAYNWTTTGTTNVWQTATSLTNTSDDYYAGRLFLMTDDSVSWGDYKPYVNLSELVEEYDYTVNGTTHYLYSPTDPDTRYDSIEVTQREQCVALNFQSYLEFNGIDFKFGQRQGVYEGYPVPRGTTDLVFRNCYVGYIGSKGSGAAYGLATFYNNLLVENCTFSDCGRRAVSVNTYTDWTGGRRIENVIVRNNVFKRGYHTTSLDLSTMNRTGDTVLYVYFYNNIIDDHEIESIGSWGASNQLFTQAGINTSLMSQIYIVGNLFIGSTSRSILFENSVTHYVWNNSITGFNSLKATSPYGSFAFGGADTIDMRNNIFYDNLPNNSLENNLVHGYNAGIVYFPHRDYNLYYTLYPGGDRNFTSIQDLSGNHFYNTTQWAAYRTAYPLYDAHSPTPQNPDFNDYANYDFSLSSTSEAIGNGEFPGYILVTDPFGVVDTINKHDVIGNEYSTSSWDIGAYAYSSFDSTQTDIVSFSFVRQNGSATINATNHTVSIQVIFGTALTDLIPTIGISQGASISPLSGTAQDFTSPVIYTVTSADGDYQQNWTVTVTVQAGSSVTDILTFVIPNQTNSVVNATNHTVTINMPYGTNVTSLSPTISLSAGATINPTSGVSRNFTTPQTYTVTAEDGITTQNWIVTINITEEVFHGKLKDNGSFVKYNGHFIVF